MLIGMIPLIDASKFDTEIENYCLEHDISTHYQNDVAYIEDDGNPIAKFLKKNNIEYNHGYGTKHEGWLIGIYAT